MSIILYIFLAVTLVSLVSLVGIVTVFFREDKFDKALAFLIPLAVGALLGDAFFHLIPEAFEEIENAVQISFLLFLGVISFFFLEKILRWHHHHSISDKISDKHDTPTHLGHMVLASDAFHNFIDGVIIAASFLVSIPVGIATTVAVFLHEIPQEIGDFGVLIHSGYSVSRALFLNFCVALFSLLGVIIAVIIGPAVQGFSEAVLPLTAGTFIYIAASDLVPELHKVSDPKKSLLQLLFMLIGIGLMYGLLFVD